MHSSSVILASLAAITIATLTACSSPAPVATNPGSSSAPAPAPAVTTAPAASGPDACKLVSESLLTTALGADPGVGVSSPGFGGNGSTTCKYPSGLIAQVSQEADTYYSASIYDKSKVSGAVDPTSGDRGYVAAGAVLVVKGHLGVFVTGGAIGSIDKGQALAAAIVAAE